MSPKEDLREWIVDNFEVAIQENIRKKLIDYRKESLKLDEGHLNFIEEIDIDILCEIIAENIKEGILNVVDTYEEEPQWNELRFRELTPEEKEDYATYDWFCMVENLPEYGEEVLVTDGASVWIDSFDVDGCIYLSITDSEIDGVTAWMPLPEPYTGE